MTISNRPLVLLLAVATGGLPMGCFGGSSNPGNAPDASIQEDASTSVDASTPEDVSVRESASGTDGSVLDEGTPQPDAPLPSDSPSAPADGGGAEDGPIGSPVDGGTTTAVLVPALGSGFDYHQGAYSLGWYFVANATIQVTSLGFYDDKMNGLTESHPIAIYDKASQAQLVTATVAPSDPLTGYFRFTALPQPLTLTSGKEYVILAWVGSENYLAFNSLDPGWTVAAAITYEGSAVNYADAMATGLIYPDTFTPNGGDFGPNFQFVGP